MSSSVLFSLYPDFVIFDVEVDRTAVDAVFVILSDDNYSKSA